jgi:hypothetical protein
MMIVNLFESTEPIFNIQIIINEIYSDLSILSGYKSNMSVYQILVILVY